MKKIGFASGKGGAGKTTLALSYFDYIEAQKILIDCDVDAANCYLIAEKELIKQKKFFAGKKYSILSNLCVSCGKCFRGCPFKAIYKEANTYKINSHSCEGCGICLDLCAHHAIEEKEHHCGDIFLSKTHQNDYLFYAKLYPGEDNSGKLVHALKNEAVAFAKENTRDTLIFDCPPGIGCPLISAITGLDQLICVMESGASGVSDGRRLLELAQNKNIPVAVVMNKCGLNPALEKELQKELQTKNIPVLGKIPFKKEYYELLKSRQTLLASSDKMFFEDLFNTIKNYTQKESSHAHSNSYPG